MKVLYVENLLLGHHKPYIRALTSSSDYESVVITPEHNSELSCKQYVYPKMSFEKKKLRDYCICMNYIVEIVKKEKADIIHFLDGDKIMRYFGYRMNRVAATGTVVITFHHFFDGFIRKKSYQYMCRNRYAVVHTGEFEAVLRKYGIQKIRHVEYPSFLPLTQRICHNSVPVIGMFGGTRIDKGLDILIEALKKVTFSYKLIIAGREADYSKNDIEQMIKGIENKVQLDLRFLSDEELSAYWDQTDLVVLPYRLTFDGASGQLTEGVNRQLPIIGPNHGSLGKIIEENHLGLIFVSENSDDLAEKIEFLLKNGFSYDSTAMSYKEQMSPERFKKEYVEIYTNAIMVRR